MCNKTQAGQKNVNPYADPVNPALPQTGFKLDRSKAALVVIDPQNDFLSPSGASGGGFWREHHRKQHRGARGAAVQGIQAGRDHGCRFAALLLPGRPGVAVWRTVGKGDAQALHV